MFNYLNIIKEACVDTLEQAILAEKLGADRIELCSYLNLDGLTPDRQLIKEAVKILNIPLKIMIRPKSGDFNYNKQDIKEMESDLNFCKNNGIGEVVFGVLDKNKKINLEETSRLANIASPMKITFHKAIDHTENILDELESLSSINEITSILTSGKSNFVLDSSNRIKQILENYRSRFNIILAGGITEKNLKKVHRNFNAKEYHGKRIVGNLL